MKIYRLYGAMDLRLEQAPTPKPGPGEVQLRTAYVGICGSDMPRLLHGKGVPFFPATLGHEFSAVVTEVGPGVSNVRPATMSSLHPDSYAVGVYIAAAEMPGSAWKEGSLGWLFLISAALRNTMCCLRKMLSGFRSRWTWRRRQWWNQSPSAFMRCL